MLQNLVFPRTSAQWARTLAFLMVPVTCFIAARDWLGFWVIFPVALVYVLVFLSHFARVSDDRGLEQPPTGEE